MIFAYKVVSALYQLQNSGVSFTVTYEMREFIH